MDNQPAKAGSAASWWVRLQANSRPMPAIPAVAVLLLMVILPVTATIGQASSPSDFLIYGIAAGLLFSAVLAIAAGLCSFAPPLIWIVMSAWVLSLLRQTELPELLFNLVYFGLVLMLAALLIQIWRVLTRRFVPTLNDEREESEG